jgi:hypothetical protein
MSLSRTALVLGLAALTVAPGAQASASRAALNGTVCNTLSAKQVTTVHVSSSCRPKTIKGSFNTLYSGIWSQPSKPGVELTVSVAVFPSTSSPAYQIGLQHMSVLPGKSKKVSGIGSKAHESGADGGLLSSINFVVGRSIVNIGLRSAHPLTSLGAFNALAKSVAAKV